MDAESECIACNVRRIVIGVTLVARGYEMRSLECPKCSNLFRIVVPQRRPVRNRLAKAAGYTANRVFDRKNTRSRAQMAAFGGDANMAEYRAYIMDKDGLISRAIGLVCPDDKTAMEHVKQFVDGHDVELWKHECRIATFKHKHE